MRVRLLRAEHAAIDAVGQRRRAVGVVEHAGPRLGVELQPVGGDAVFAGLEHDVAGGDDPVAVVKISMKSAKNCMSSQSTCTGTRARP